MDENLVFIKRLKITKRGKNGAFISLPHFWLEYNGVKGGDSMGMFQAPGSSDIILKIYKEKDNG